MTNSNSECLSSIIANFEFKKVLVNNLQISHYKYRVSLNSVPRNSEQGNIFKEDRIEGNTVRRNHNDGKNEEREWLKTSHK